MTEDQVVADLLASLSAEERERLAAHDREDSLLLLHHGFGTMIRNRYGLWRPDRWGNHADGDRALDSDEPWPEREMAEHPDDVSFRILRRVWELCRKEAGL
jgi:hypothetical protein